MDESKSVSDSDSTPTLDVVMFPWLAIGHLIPFLELSKRLAEKGGHRISFLTTPRNLQRLPPIPENLLTKLNFVTLPIPQVVGLPEGAEASTDIPIEDTQLLKIAFDGLESLVFTFLQNSKPDWIIYDYASHWLPSLAAKLGLSCAYFGLFTAATLCFNGPPWAMLNRDKAQLIPEELTLVPEWVPFNSNIVYRLHEILPYFKGASANGQVTSGASDFLRFAVSVRDSDFVALRSFIEFEPEWITLLSELYQKPVVPVGSLHPLVEEHQIGENWILIKEWLDTQKQGSVVYVALGSEATLTRDQIIHLALGLECSELPFYWALRNPPGSVGDVLGMLPEGFIERTRGRGVICTSWVPQVRILSHDSVGGFLTHCGWNSVIEALGFGRVLVLLPILNDQGLNARLLEGKKVGHEIPRDEEDGSFTCESVAKSLKMVMVDKEGEIFRTNAKQLREIFGDKKRMNRYIDDLIEYLKKNRHQRRPHQLTRAHMD